MIPFHTRHPQTRKVSLHGGGDRSDHCQVLIVFDDLRGDGELVVLLMSEPEPAPDLGSDVLDHFPVSQLIEDDALLFPELIVVCLIRHSRFSFLACHP